MSYVLYAVKRCWCILSRLIFDEHVGWKRPATIAHGEFLTRLGADAWHGNNDELTSQWMMIEYLETGRKEYDAIRAI